MKSCPQCTAEAPMEDRFCEECGAHLGSPGKDAAVCAKCGAGANAIDTDGFCSACGFRREPPVRDHFERVVSAGFAGITDRGIRHYRNEDFFAMDLVGDAHVMVVCDGVSSTTDADRASEAAVDAVFRSLVQSIALPEAIEKAQSAVADLAGDAATTVVAAVVRASRADIAWVGDSRAYWISREDSRQLTKDDSWLNEVVASGEMAHEDAEKSAQAHAITRWLGSDAQPEESAAKLVQFDAPGEGYLLLCSDGLWNYVSDAKAMAQLIYEQAAGEAVNEAVNVVRALVDFANAQGGQDNITAVLLYMPQALSPAPLTI